MFSTNLSANTQSSSIHNVLNVSLISDSIENRIIGKASQLSALDSDELAAAQQIPSNDYLLILGYNSQDQLVYDHIKWNPRKINAETFDPIHGEFVEGSSLTSNLDSFNLLLPKNANISRVVVYQPVNIKLNQFQQLQEYNLNTQRKIEAAQADFVDGQNGVYSISTGNDSENSLDFVIVSDGYTAAEMDKFAQDAKRVVDGFLAESPFKEYASVINFWRVEVPSSVSGAGQGAPINTPFKAYFNCAGIQRLICVDTNAVFNHLNSVMSVDKVDEAIVLVNSEEYGGSGGPASVVSANSSAIGVAIHEVGHTLGHLADEYIQSSLCSQNSTNEPSEINATRDPNVAKWSRWMAFDGNIGAYEGGRYCATGIYRPSFNSKMRAINQPFDAVGNEQMIKQILSHTSIVSNHKGHLTLDPLLTQTLSIELIDDTQLANLRLLSPVININWYDESTLLATGPVLTITNEMLENGLRTNLTAEISYQVEAVLDPIVETVSWTIEDDLCQRSNGHQVPGKIEAEDYCNMFGVKTEPTTDDGAGENIGYVSVGDRLEYKLDVAQAGDYIVRYRVASDGGSTGFSAFNQNIAVNDTQGWQNWLTIENTVTLSAGPQVITFNAINGGWNLNWFELEKDTNDLIDTDLDGIFDEQDNCIAIANPQQANFDQDEWGDACDLDDDNDTILDEIELACGEDPLAAFAWDSIDAHSDAFIACLNGELDYDNDGVNYLTDNCPEYANKGQWDFEQDGLGNACDDDDDNDGYSDSAEKQAGSNSKDPASTPSNLVDTDGDTIRDSIDNCPNKANKRQWDYDKDGLGNACDLDDDNDGFSDKEEKSYGTKPKDATSFPVFSKDDTDGDSIIDSLDNCINQANTKQYDYDRDGIGNACDSDDDNDGFTDVVEKAAGSKPRDASSTPAG